MFKFDASPMLRERSHISFMCWIAWAPCCQSSRCFDDGQYLAARQQISSPMSVWLRCFAFFKSCRDYTKHVRVLEPIGQVEVQTGSCYELDLALRPSAPVAAQTPYHADRLSYECHNWVGFSRLAPHRCRIDLNVCVERHHIEDRSACSSGNCSLALPGWQ